jgi:hypothetical protein
MTREEEALAETFGQAAPYSEHKRGERIAYRLPGEPGEHLGLIVWCAAACDQAAMCYIVVRDGAGDSFPDIVFPAYVL